MTALNYAERIAIGGNQASAIYVGATKIWPFVPTMLTGCCVWIDASKLALANGAAVSSWTNLGSGSQPTIAAGATFRTGALNSLPVVRITQGTGRMRWYSGTGVDKDWTLVYIGRRWQFRGGRIVAAYTTGANLLVGYHGNEMDQCFVEGWLTGQTQTSTAQWRLYSADSTSSAVARFFSNGALLNSGTATPAKGWGGTLCISGYADDASGQEADCEIAELVMYNRKLSDNERAQVENYLRYKWLRVPLWNPTSLGSNRIAWFDSSDSSTIQVAGSGVNNWVNKGVGGMTVGQGTDASRPVANGLGVTFTPTQGMTAAGGPASYDCVMVCKPNPNTTPADWRTMLRSANCHEMIIENGSTRLGTYNAGFLPAGGLTWSNVDGLATMRVAPSTAVLISRDGGALTSTGTALPSASAAPTMFGAYVAPPASQGFGAVKEIVFTPYNLESERQRIEGYLAWKWGLEPLLPGGHPYKSAPP